jgi:ATP-dependent DNA ligase
LIQTASGSGNAGALVFFLFDLLYLDGEVTSAAPLHERKGRLRDLLSNAGTPLQYSDHQIGRGAEFYTRACESFLEGIISKRTDAPYSPGDRGLWVKTSAYGVGRNLSPLPRCRSISPHLGQTALVHRSSSAACNGFAPSLWSRSNT